MAAKYSIRNYNAFIKEARAQHGLSLREARAAYKGVTERLGRPARGVDVGRHPRITKQEAQKASKQIAREDRSRKREGNRERREREKREKTGGAGMGEIAKPAKAFKSLADYWDWYQDAEDYGYEEADGTVDY